MPGKEMCKKIKDPKQKADCMAYKGKFAKYKKPASTTTDASTMVAAKSAKSY